MTTYYKAVRPDGTDFYSSTIDYAAALGRSVRARTPKADRYHCCTPDVLHAADVPTETLIGGSWPCRLFEVEGKPVASKGHKYGFQQLRVVREVDAHLALGPQGREVAALIERAGSLAGDEASRLAVAYYAARYAARYAAWYAAGNAAGYAARGAAWNAAGNAAGGAAWNAAGNAAGGAAGNAAGGAAWGAAWNAARALVVRDLIGSHGFEQRHYDALTHPWREAIGPVHPEDAAVTA